MNDNHIAAVAEALALESDQVRQTANLLAEGGSIPFIARYRKEATGSLDEVQIAEIRDRLHRLQELETRRTAILKSLEQHGRLTDELRQRVLDAPSLTVLEDVYLPFRPKRQTRATLARQKGLAPLADTLLAQNGEAPHRAAAAHVDTDRGVPSTDIALAGARDIIAEMVSEDERARTRMRELFRQRATLRCTVSAGKEAEAQKYRDYFDWSEPAAKAPSHRILAVRRGEKEDLLNVSITPPEPEALAVLNALFVRGDGEDAQQVRQAVADGYRRLLSRAMETEIRLALKNRAEAEAIRIFGDNLRELLMAPALGAKRVMAIDPGFRTGCKLACLDRQGKLLHHETIFPHTSHPKKQAAEKTVRRLAKQFAIEAVAIGNGTAGRETETFIRQVFGANALDIALVDESGASVYSASDSARQEFADLDLTVRGAISIGRRLMDPLSELVKIEPKSIGVGQYQHDVDQAALKRALDDVVVSCVNQVGVDLNRASARLLSYVSGLGPRLAQQIVAYRDANGPFQTRRALQDVPRLGPKAFEQAAGFLRIPHGPDPLDASAVHPESYPVVARMAVDLNRSVADLIGDAGLPQKIDLNAYVSDTVGLPTLRDILAELAKPGRDPRQPFETFRFAADIAIPADLEIGMTLPGIVTNVTAFGAFVDIGVHQDGLVHISELADAFVKDPSDVVKVRQNVTVRVLSVDLERRRISLSMRKSANPDLPKRKKGPAAPRST